MPAWIKAAWLRHGFWIHRALKQEGIDSHVLDPASVATSRRRRRAKTDRLDGETLLRTLLVFKRGDPRTCAMVRPPSPEEEDRRRNSRERRVLIGERVRLVNRIKGLLFCPRRAGFQPLKTDRRSRIPALTAAGGGPLPQHLLAEIGRMLDRIELILEHLKANEAMRDAMIATPPQIEAAARGPTNLMMLKGTGPDFAEIFGRKGSTDTSTIGGNLPRMPAWHRGLGRAATSVVSKASRKPGTHDFERSWCSSRGSGCCINQTRL